MILSVLNLKGGVGKTTSAYFLAAALHASGESVVLVDADPQQSALRWCELADPPWAYLAMPTKSLHRDLAKLVQPGQHVVIDTPPGEVSIAASAMRAADVMLIPTAATTADVLQLDETTGLADDVRTLTGARIAVLLTRVDRRANAPAQVRATISAQGWHILDTEIPQAQALALACGEPVTDPREYAAVLAELRGM